MVLAGSIVSTEYPWHERYGRNQVEKLRNYTADRDYAVACFPAVYERLPRTFFLEWIGSAGVSGFNHVRANTNVSLSGGHSIAVSEEKNQTLISDFVLDEEVQRQYNPVPRSEDSY